MGQRLRHHNHELREHRGDARRRYSRGRFHERHHQADSQGGGRQRPQAQGEHEGLRHEGGARRHPSRTRGRGHRTRGRTSVPRPDQGRAWHRAGQADRHPAHRQAIRRDDHRLQARVQGTIRPRAGEDRRRNARTHPVAQGQGGHAPQERARIRLDAGQTLRLPAGQ